MRTLRICQGTLALVLLVLPLSACALLPNKAPTAVIDPSHLTGRAPLRTSFNAYDSDDPDGEIARCRWEFGDGGSDEGMYATHVFGEVGVYTVTLTVWDDDGASDSASFQITVLEGPALSDFRIANTRWEPSTCYFLALAWPCVYVYVTIESDSPYPANVVVEATARNSMGAYLGSNELYWNDTCDIPARETFVLDGKILFMEGPTPSVATVDARIVRVEACN